MSANNLKNTSLRPLETTPTTEPQTEKSPFSTVSDDELNRHASKIEKVAVDRLEEIRRQEELKRFMEIAKAD